MSDKTHERWMTPYPAWNKSYSLNGLLPLADQTQTLQLTLAQTVMSSPTWTAGLLAGPDLSSVPWPDAYTVTHLRGQILLNFQTLLAVVGSNTYVSLGIVMDTADSRGSQTIFNPAQYLDSQRHWKWLHHELWVQSALFTTYTSNVKKIDLDVSLGIRVSDLDRLSLCVAWWASTPLNSECVVTPFLRLLATGAT